MWVRFVTGRAPRFALVLVLPGALALPGCGGSSQRPTTTQTRTVTASQTTSQSAAAASDPLASLVAKVKSSVIRIETNACGLQEIGTGFLIGPRLIATVEHVVDGASSITLQQGNKTVGTGTVIGEDQTRDVALVQASAPISGTQLQLASRAPALGESVAALGFPLGLPLTVTQGLVSGLGRTVPINGINRAEMVQTDAAVNPGNSGGPLLALDSGQVVGLVDLGTNLANGIGFAVSAQVAQPLLEGVDHGAAADPRLHLPVEPTLGGGRDTQHRRRQPRRRAGIRGPSRHPTEPSRGSRLRAVPGGVRTDVIRLPGAQSELGVRPGRRRPADQHHLGRHPPVRIGDRAGASRLLRA